MQVIYLLRRFDMDFIQAFEDVEECEDVAIKLNQRARDLGLDEAFYVEERPLLKNIEPDSVLRGGEHYVRA